MKKYKIIIASLLLFIMFTPTIAFAKVDKSNYNDDPAVGTASKDIERAIEAGKQLIGSVNYYMLNHNRTNLQMMTYDYANDASSTGKLGIDCSEFVSYAFSKGYGIQWGGDNVGATNTWGFVNPSYTPKEYLKTISSWSEAKRGDIVLTNDYGHVVIYLGENMILGSNGDNSSSETAGPSIKPASYFKIAQGNYNVVRLPDKASDAKGGILQKGHPSDDLKINGSKESEDSESTKTEDTVEQSKFVGENAWKNKMINFQNQVYKSTFKGIDTGSTGFVNSAFISGLNKSAQKVLNYAYIGMMIITTGLFLFMFLATVIYLVILPNGIGGYKMMDIFEKTTGLDSAVNKQNTWEIIGRLGITTLVIACLYANVLPILISGFIKLILMVLNLF